MPPKIDDAREILLSCGKKTLLRNAHGQYGKFSIRELTAECGLATGTFYSYFKNKDDLARQVLSADWDGVISKNLEIIHSDKTVYEKLDTIYTNIKTFEQAYQYSLKLFTPSKSNVEFSHRNLQKLYNSLKALLEIEIQRGSFEIKTNLDNAAYLLGQFLFSAAISSAIAFEELWNCLNLFWSLMKNKPGLELSGTESDGQ